MIIQTEDVNDRAKLIMHRLVWMRMAVDPNIIQRSIVELDRLEEREGVTDYYQSWRRALENRGSELRNAMCSRDEFNTRLRVASPVILSSGMNFTGVVYRKRIWKVAKKLVTIAYNKSRSGI